ncbi:CidA/LrgA family protein [Parasporobacterium paucivorans]|uniref:Holin-like protein n=1 Tax=Parasporobacterium paucivorans DSM 15970 TaxID=1122934 RepID=A0A1M6HNQ4_9FIRM|nr:CidA/LrgA family protein [Parasporobacterium paucivorans]SHJ23881.1 holin-like protein [Parasporobacterium paucivorans DSM 15970]
MKILKQLLIIFAVCLCGELISEVLPVVIPASVISMVLLLALLSGKIIRTEQIRETADFLLANLSLFFVPLIVDIVDNLYLIKGIVFPIFFICIFTTFLTFAVTAFTVAGMIRFLDRRSGKKNA